MNDSDPPANLSHRARGTKQALAVRLAPFYPGVEFYINPATYKLVNRFQVQRKLMQTRSSRTGMSLERGSLKQFSRNPGGEKATMRPCDQSIKKTLEMAERMLELADEGDRVTEDSGCGILYGVLRDSAFRIRQLAEKERDAHIRKGWWRK